MRLKGKVALVTGGASGIGYAIAERFAIEGANVAIADVDGESAEAAAERLQETAQANIAGIPMDVTKEDQVESGVRDVLQRYGKLDVLCSNAGVEHIAAVHELTYSDWKKVTSVHLDGAFLTTRACLRHMYHSGRGGTILYMGSVHSKIASVLKAPYVAAKHGIVGLCRTVAKEGAQYGVRANVICPGFVRTALVEKQIPEQAELLGMTAEEVIQKVMLKDAIDGQFTTTDEIAEAAVFLAQQRTLALTGQSIIVSHGWVME